MIISLIRRRGDSEVRCVVATTETTDRVLARALGGAVCAPIIALLVERWLA